MPKTERSRDVRVAFDELSEPVPRLRVGGGRWVVLQHCGDERTGERDAEHGCPAQKRPVAWGEPVDAGRDERFDRVRRLLLSLALGRSEFLQEQRVAGAAIDDGSGLLLAQTALARGRRAQR